jgi:heat shock protein HslJ
LDVVTIAVYIAGMLLVRGVIGCALMTVVLVTGCLQKAKDGPDAGMMGAAGSGGSNGPDLNNRSFILDSSEGFTPVMDTTVRVFFQDRDFGFSAGCNSFSGAYTLEGRELVVESFGSTQIGCQTALQEQDEWLADFFSTSPRLTLSGNQLTLAGDEATLIFMDREVADPDRLLTSGTWVVDSLIQGGVAQAGFPANPTVRFDTQGNVQVFTGCNSGSGDYEVLGTEITLTGMIYTEEVCNEVQSIPVEEHIEQVLQDGIVTFQIEAARLTLMRADLGFMATTE